MNVEKCSRCGSKVTMKIIMDRVKRCPDCTHCVPIVKTT